MTAGLAEEYARQWMSNEWGAIKHPDDLERYRFIIEQTRPDVVVETGTHIGGSARFFANLGVDVVTVDTRPLAQPLPGVTQVVGQSTKVVGHVAKLVAGRCVMVSLDSDHSTGYVLAELEAYAPLVSPGCFCVVEDGIVSFHNPDGVDGSPREAALAYFTGRPGWAHDDEVAGLTPFTMHPEGWWRRGQ